LLNIFIVNGFNANSTFTACGDGNISFAPANNYKVASTPTYNFNIYSGGYAQFRFIDNTKNPNISRELKIMYNGRIVWDGYVNPFTLDAHENPT